MGAAVNWVSTATPRSITLLLLLFLATLTGVGAIALRLAKRVQEHGGGSVEIDLKAVGLHTKVTFTPSGPHAAFGGANQDGALSGGTGQNDEAPATPAVGTTPDQGGGGP